LENSSAENGLSLRLFVLLLFTLVLFVGVSASYSVIANSNWSGVDLILANSMKLFYVFVALLGVCLFAALVLLAIDERKIRRLFEELEKERREGKI
jgi:hypothetical protein